MFAIKSRKTPEDIVADKEVTDILTNMNPYAFERLTQRVLRECGFTDVIVTKSSGDGGIDGAHLGMRQVIGSRDAGGGEGEGGAGAGQRPLRHGGGGL